MISTKSFTIFCLLIAFTSCNSKTNAKTEFVDRSLDSSIKTIKISIKDLTKEYKSLNGRYIETEGILYWEFENVALCDSRGRSSKCFWLDFDRNLKINDSLLTLSSAKEIVLKGIIDTSSKGHLGSYLATIGNIYYLKQK